MCGMDGDAGGVMNVLVLCTSDMHRIQFQLGILSIRSCARPIQSTCITCADDERDKVYLKEVTEKNKTYEVPKERDALTHITSDLCRTKCAIYDEDILDSVSFPRSFAFLL